MVGLRRCCCKLKKWLKYEVVNASFRAIVEPSITKRMSASKDYFLILGENTWNHYWLF